jgi:hypothetical protein
LKMQISRRTNKTKSLRQGSIRMQAGYWTRGRIVVLR